MADIDITVGGTRNQQSVVMIRNVTKIDADYEYLGLLGVSRHTTLRFGRRRHRDLLGMKMRTLGQCTPLEQEFCLTGKAHRHLMLQMERFRMMSSVVWLSIESLLPAGVFRCHGYERGIWLASG